MCKLVMHVEKKTPTEESLGSCLYCDKLHQQTNRLVEIHIQQKDNFMSVFKHFKQGSEN